MKFDVIIGNPPYQLKTAGNENGAQARPIYNLFVEKAIMLKPKYLVMITPSRWMTGGWNLDEFRFNLAGDNHIEELHDFPDAGDCFPGVEIKGGVCFYKWNRDFDGDCLFYSHSKNEIISKKSRCLLSSEMDTIVRYNEAISIIKKVRSFHEQSFSEIASPMKPFGLPTKYKGSESKTSVKSIKVYANQNVFYEDRSKIEKNNNLIDKYKIIVPKAVGTGNPNTDKIKPILCEPGSCCTETYILIGPFNSKAQCDNALSYMKTRFFHFMLTLHKDTQDCLKKTYMYIPMQNFEEEWTDKKLFSKYNLSDEEIKFIKSLIWPSQEG